MFELFEERSHLPAERERVARLMMSLNEPMIAPSHHHAQPTHAYICTFKEDDGFSVYVHLYLTLEKVGILYRYADGLLDSEGCKGAEDEAMQFTEEMGFMVDDLNFSRLFTSEQEKLLASIPLFAPKAAVPEKPPVEKKEVIAEEVVERVLPVEEEKVEEVAESIEPMVEEVAAPKEPQEKGFEPEIFLSKFRMRMAAEKMKKAKG
jgi:hypothetical protein